MGRIVHARGDLKMAIRSIDVAGDQLQIRGQMGVWDAQILLEPAEVVTMAISMFRPRMIRYLLALPWKTVRSGLRR